MNNKIHIELHRLKQMYLIIPTIGIDTEYRCVFITWLNRAIYLGLGKKNEL
jgi:hypothetical protein